MYERILIPIDGSSYAEAAATTGFEVAKTFGAQAFVLCVVDTGPLASVQLPGDAARAGDVLHDQAEAFIDEIRDRAVEFGVDVSTDVREGVPVDEILQHIDEIDADLVVMGSQGRHGVGRLLLGSVTQGVTRQGDVDVLVVDADEEG